MHAPHNPSTSLPCSTLMLHACTTDLHPTHFLCMLHCCAAAAAAPHAHAYLLSALGNFRLRRLQLLHHLHVRITSQGPCVCCHALRLHHPAQARTHHALLQDMHTTPLDRICQPLSQKWPLNMHCCRHTQGTRQCGGYCCKHTQGARQCGGHCCRHASGSCSVRNTPEWMIAHDTGHAGAGPVFLF